MSLQSTFHFIRYSQVWIILLLFCTNSNENGKSRFSFPVAKLSLIFICVFGLTESSLSQLRSHKLEIRLFVCLFMDMVAWLDLCLSINNCFKKAKLACLHHSSNVRYFFLIPFSLEQKVKKIFFDRNIFPSDDWKGFFYRKLLMVKLLLFRFKKQNTEPKKEFEKTDVDSCVLMNINVCCMAFVRLHFLAFWKTKYSSMCVEVLSHMAVYWKCVHSMVNLFDLWCSLTFFRPMIKAHHAKWNIKCTIYTWNMEHDKLRSIFMGDGPTVGVNICQKLFFWRFYNKRNNRTRNLMANKNLLFYHMHTACYAIYTHNGP